MRIDKRLSPTTWWRTLQADLSYSRARHLDTLAYRPKLVGATDNTWQRAHAQAASTFYAAQSIFAIDTATFYVFTPLAYVSAACETLTSLAGTVVLGAICGLGGGLGGALRQAGIQKQAARGARKAYDTCETLTHAIIGLPTLLVLMGAYLVLKAGAWAVGSVVGQVAYALGDKRYMPVGPPPAPPRRARPEPKPSQAPAPQSPHARAPAPAPA